jgi:hypothetical protein
MRIDIKCSQLLSPHADTISKNYYPHVIFVALLIGLPAKLCSCIFGRFVILLITGLSTNSQFIKFCKCTFGMFGCVTLVKFFWNVWGMQLC